MGYINQNKLVEVTAKDLISEYIGQTSGKTFNVVKSALGGVLFIDEAYSITFSNGTTGANFGEECIATLLKLMEDYKDKLIVIFAGYKDEMNKFLDTNPGLTSRIGYKVQFEDFTIDELTQIFVNLLHNNKLEITDEGLKEAQRIIKISAGIKDFGNARYINQMFQRVLIEHSKNIEYNNEKKNLYIIDKEDIKEENLLADSNRRKIGFG